MLNDVRFDFLIYRLAYPQIGIRAGLPHLGCQQDRTKKDSAMLSPCPAV
jgi:hypothetical protein